MASDINSWRRYFGDHFQWSALPAEHAGIVEFVEQHEASCAPLRCITGSKYEIRLTPSGFGMLVVIHCLGCSAYKNVTDVDKF